ncbi:MAG: hypothetical protein HWN67_22725 [Candidatus Helarchaeota archaeon]|nr:hypothetical protein [Candidatus Helarchaeota archaeon]
MISNLFMEYQKVCIECIQVIETYGDKMPNGEYGIFGYCKICDITYFPCDVIELDDANFSHILFIFIGTKHDSHS